MRATIVWVGLLLVTAVFAQERKLTIQEAMSGGMYPDRSLLLQWVDAGHYSHYVFTERGNKLEIMDLSGAVTDSVTVDLLNTALHAAGLDSIQRMPMPNWLQDGNLGFRNGNFFVSYDRVAKKAKARFDLHEQVQSVEYTQDFTGYTGLIEDGFAYRVGKYFGHLTNTTEGMVIGDVVHRNEFGIHKGLFLSPDGSMLAYYEKDERMVTTYPRYALETTPAHAEMIYYPTAGKPSHHVKLKVKFIGTEAADLALDVSGPAEQYLTNIAWTPDSKYILIAIVNREQNHMWLNQYDAASGAFIKTLFEETHPKYVEPEHPALFLPNDPSRFIWRSERDGFEHLYVYDMDGNMIRQLTEGPWVITDVYGFDGAGERIYFSATKESPLERHLYSVPLKGGKIKKHTDEPGVHEITPNADFSYFLDVYSSVDVPRVEQIIDTKCKVVHMIRESEAPVAAFESVDLELGSLMTEDGVELHYRVFKPSNLEAGKQYPAVVYLYNGPHAQMITNSYNGGANHWYQYMVQHGYVVFTIDGRGSAHRGLEFENAIFGNVGKLEMEDQLLGLKWLKSQDYVDSGRVGIHGWSYGGFMTISLMTRKPGNYKVGVAGGPVIDWELYEVMYTERYMDTPQENPEGFEVTDLKNYVDRLEGDLLVIHGALDNVVLWEHTLEYLETAIDKGVQLDYFVYPDHEHNVLGRDRVHLYDKISRYFFEKL